MDVYSHIPLSKQYFTENHRTLGENNPALISFSYQPSISCQSPTQPQLNLNSSWSDYIMTWTTPPTTTHETLCCCCAAGRVTIGDSTSLLTTTTYRATVNVVTAKIKPRPTFLHSTNQPNHSKLT